MRVLKISAFAEQELATIFDWIESKSGSALAALGVVEDLSAVFDRLSASEFELGTRVADVAGVDLRMYVHKRFVIYLRYPDPQALEIFTVLWGGRHAARYFETLAKPAES